MLKIWKDGKVIKNVKIVEEINKIMNHFKINTDRDIELFGDINDKNYYFQIVGYGSRETLLVYDNYRYIINKKEISAWEDDNC